MSDPDQSRLEERLEDIVQDLDLLSRLIESFDFLLEERDDSVL